MIDRRALSISLLVLFAMIAADFWRLSLLPNWHHVPTDGPGNTHTFPMFSLFAPALALFFTIGLVSVRKWLRSGSEDALQPWRRWYGLLLLFNTVIAALAQAFVLARSLGALQSVDRQALSRVMMVAAGVFVMVFGNTLPKMPFLTARFGPLDPWQWNRHLRFAGKIAVFLGLFLAVIMPQLSLKMVLPATVSLALAGMAANYWHRSKVKREPSPQS
jgi:hypothetical protein